MCADTQVAKRKYVYITCSQCVYTMALMVQINYDDAPKKGGSMSTAMPKPLHYWLV